MQRKNVSFVTRSFGVVLNTRWIEEVEYGWTIADLILERQTERTAVFFVNRSYIPFPDEPLRSVGANGVLELMKAEDTLDERQGLGSH